MLNVAVKSDSNVENRLKRYILNPRGGEGGERPERMRRDRPGDPHSEANPPRQLRPPCSDDGRATRSEAERSRFTTEGRAPASCLFLPLFGSLDKHPPPPSENTIATLCQGCVCGGGWGGSDLPACIWLTGDWEGALRAHVTINNPC